MENLGTLTEQRAQEIIIEAAKEIYNIEESIELKKETIKEIKKDIKDEGISMKAFNKAYREFKAIVNANPDELHEMEIADIYRESLLEHKEDII